MSRRIGKDAEPIGVPKFFVNGDKLVCSSYNLVAPASSSTTTSIEDMILNAREKMLLYRDIASRYESVLWILETFLEDEIKASVRQIDNLYKSLLALDHYVFLEKERTLSATERASMAIVRNEASEAYSKLSTKDRFIGQGLHPNTMASIERLITVNLRYIFERGQ